jgi:NDP-sugar pyrophosphorylase family protein
LVLAAGKSTRIASVAQGHPKPLIPLGGESILVRNLRWLGAEGVRRVWINLHYRPEEIRTVVGDGAHLGVDVQYVHEPEVLGTAGAVRNLAAQWTGTFLVVYGDNLLRLDLSPFLRFHRAHKAPVSVALFDRRSHPHTGIAGGRVVLGSDGRIQKFAEGGDEARSSLVNAGVYLLEPEIVSEIPAGRAYDFGRDLFPSLLTRGVPLYGYVIDGYCLGVDTPDSYQEAIRLIAAGKVVLM